MAFLQSEPHTRISLAPHEMLAISRAISREFAPRYTRPEPSLLPKKPAFSPQELLAISREIRREYAPSAAEGVANLVLMPIDPMNVHVYWQLPEFTIKPHSSSTAAPQELTLRIFRQEPPPALSEAKAAAEPAWFDIAIDAESRSMQVALPLPLSSDPSANAYSAAIGWLDGDRRFLPLVQSNAADMPPVVVSNQQLSLHPSVTRFIIPAMNAASPVGKSLLSSDD